LRGVTIIEKAVSDPKRLSRINNLLEDWGKLISIVDDTPPAWSLSITSSFPFEPKAWFLEKGLTYVLKKSGDGRYRFDFSAKALKKKIVQSFEYKKLSAGEAELRMTVFDKFDPEGFVRESFAFKDKNDWVRVNVESELNKRQRMI
jgi:hypothetical protein